MFCRYSLCSALSLLIAVNFLSAGELVKTDASIGKAKQLVESDRVLIIAHRGASAHAPENTIPAFKLGIKAKADLVELDYYHAADNVPIVFHDKDLDRTTNARRKLGKRKVPIGRLTSRELKQLDAGSWFDKSFAGTRVPTLDESLDVIQNGSITLVERKGGDAKRCVDMLRDKRLIDDVVVQAFDWDYVRDCHQLEPSLVLGALGSKKLTAKQLDEIETTGASLVVWKAADLNKSAIDAIHDRGFKAWCYTVNDAKELKRLVDIGIDGVITDKPAEMRAELKVD